jgi:hypothetical protein
MVGMTETTKTTTLRITLAGRRVEVDLSRLTPTAAALARAIGNTPGQADVDIWMESDQPIREIVANWEHFYTPQEANRFDRYSWRGWSTRPLGDEDPHMRLEYEATKIPPGWHVAGAKPMTEYTIKQVVAFLLSKGRPITAGTWRAYVARGQAPAPVRRVGATPLWRREDVEAWRKEAVEA